MSVKAESCCLLHVPWNSVSGWDGQHHHRHQNLASAGARVVMDLSISGAPSWFSCTKQVKNKGQMANSTIVNTYNSCGREVETRGSGVQREPLLHREFEATLGYIKPCLKTTHNESSCDICKKAIFSLGLFIHFWTAPALSTTKTAFWIKDIFCPLRPPSARSTGVSPPWLILVSQGQRAMHFGQWGHPGASLCLAAFFSLEGNAELRPLSSSDQCTVPFDLM